MVRYGVRGSGPVCIPGIAPLVDGRTGDNLAAQINDDAIASQITRQIALIFLRQAPVCAAKARERNCCCACLPASDAIVTPKRRLVIMRVPTYAGFAHANCNRGIAIKMASPVAGEAKSREERHPCREARFQYR